MPNSLKSDADPPRPFRRTSAVSVELCRGGGLFSLLGVLFVVVGVVLAVKADWPGLVDLASLAFLLAGVSFTFGRRWLTLDIGSGSVVRSHGLLFPMFREEHRLNEFTAVVITFLMGDSESPDRYPVSLRPLSGKNFTISSPAEFNEARKQAEFLSQFLRLPLADTTSDHEVVVNPERVGETLQQRLSRETAPGLPARPQTMRSEVNESRDKTTVIIPGRTSTLMIIIATSLPVVVIVIAGPILWRFFTHSGTPLGVTLAFLAFLVFMFGILPVQMAFARRSRTTVTASPAGIEVEFRTGWHPKTTTVPAADILDLDYSTMDGILESTRRSTGMGEPSGISASRPFAMLKNLIPSKGIVVKARNAMIRFGEGLPADELAFLRAILTKALAHR